MKSVFVDTSAWYAVMNAGDRDHEHARQFMSEALNAYGKLVTTNLIVGETYTLVRSRFDHRHAWRFVEAIWSTPRITRVFVSERDEEEAYRLLGRFKDLPLSYVDATSFAVMNARRVFSCFGFDRHFRAAGFDLLPE